MVGSRRLTELGQRVKDSVSEALRTDRRPIVVALSGGADSAILAWAVIGIGTECRAAHVHHGWPASDRMAETASEVATHLGIQLNRIDVNTDGCGSLEAVAREARYEALESAREDGELVATGHTRNDQAETVIGNLMWGSGLDGLGGIHRRRHGLIRPMLSVPRNEVRELATLVGVPFADDPANNDARFRRVRIRRALAEWDERLAPGMIERLADTAELVRADIELLDEQLSEVRIWENEDAVRLASGMLRTLPDSAARRLIRQALRRVGSGHPGSRRDVEAVLAVAFGAPATEIAGGHRVARVGASVQVGKRTHSVVSPSSQLDFSGPVRWADWRWVAHQYEGQPTTFPLSKWTQVFDASVFRPNHPAAIRVASRADQITIRGGHKSAFAALTEAGVPAQDRSEWPILDVAGDVLWIPGVRRAYAGWVSNDTRRYVVVTAQREERWKPVAY